MEENDRCLYSSSELAVLLGLKLLSISGINLLDLRQQKIANYVKELFSLVRVRSNNLKGYISLESCLS